MIKENIVMCTKKTETESDTPGRTKNKEEEEDRHIRPIKRQKIKRNRRKRNVYCIIILKRIPYIEFNIILLVSFRC